MADNRQFTDHNEIGGVNVYLEDKKLGELKDATAVTTVSGTQFIPLQDSTNGNLEKIGTSALASVLGVASKEIFENNYNLNKAPVGIVKSSNADIVASLQNAPIPSQRANFMCETQEINGSYRFQTFWYTSASWTAPKIYVRFSTSSAGWTTWSAIINQ